MFIEILTETRIRYKEADERESVLCWILLTIVRGLESDLYIDRDARVANKRSNDAVRQIFWFAKQLGV